MASIREYFSTEAEAIERQAAITSEASSGPAIGHQDEWETTYNNHTFKSQEMAKRYDSLYWFGRPLGWSEELIAKFLHHRWGKLGAAEIQECMDKAKAVNHPTMVAKYVDYPEGYPRTRVLIVTQYGHFDDVELRSREDWENCQYNIT
jgi:hypothetical protein